GLRVGAWVPHLRLCDLLFAPLRAISRGAEARPRPEPPAQACAECFADALDALADALGRQIRVVRSQRSERLLGALTTLEETAKHLPVHWREASDGTEVAEPAELFTPQVQAEVTHHSPQPRREGGGAGGVVCVEPVELVLNQLFADELEAVGGAVTIGLKAADGLVDE